MKLDTFGIVMNFDPSLFVYFEVGFAFGELGEWSAGDVLRFAGIPIWTACRQFLNESTAITQFLLGSPAMQNPSEPNVNG